VWRLEACLKGRVVCHPECGAAGPEPYVTRPSHAQHVIVRLIVRLNTVSLPLDLERFQHTDIIRGVVFVC